MQSSLAQRVRTKKSLSRTKYSRLPRERILIVCEGEKTEVNYFEAIRRFHRLSSTHICVTYSQLGTSPRKILESAKECCKNRDNKFDSVFCVFDRDDHKDFKNAIVECHDIKIKNDLNKRMIFRAIPSVPSFEIWFLMHFRQVTSEIEREKVLAELKHKYISEYNKADKNHFGKTRCFLNNAYTNAQKIKNNKIGDDIRNPYTDVDELVKILLNMEIASSPS